MKVQVPPPPRWRSSNSIRPGRAGYLDSVEWRSDWNDRDSRDDMDNRDVRAVSTVYDTIWWMERAEDSSLSAKNVSNPTAVPLYVLKWWRQWACWTVVTERLWGDILKTRNLKFEILFVPTELSLLFSILYVAILLFWYKNL